MIRRGSESDLGTAAAIKIANWSDTYRELIPPDVLAPFLEHAHALDDLRAAVAHSDALFLVAEDDAGDVVGFSLAYLDMQPDPWLESLHVGADERGRGVGSALLHEVARAVCAHGRNSLRLGVVRGNRGAGRLYERLGATRIGIEPAAWARAVEHELYRWRDLSRLSGPNYNSGL